MTVDENLRMQTKPNEKGGVDAAVDAFPRLAQRRRQLAGSLSGGEQQMLALASMYLGRPEVVLLDEVSMGLAPKIVDELYVHLRKAAASGAALLLVEQYVSRALNLAQYVYVLKKGEVDFVGQPCELGESEVLAAYLGVSA
jgi:branched-chain amino acid transport system ATP-binding protein